MSKEEETVNKDEQSELDEQAQSKEENVEVNEENESSQESDLNDKYLRLYSDFENFRKRSAKEKLDIIKTASNDIMKDMIIILDDFERAINANKEVEDVKTLKDGFSLIHDKFKKSLVSKGLSEIEAKGEVFDVDKHEALTQIPVDKKNQKGKVVDVIEKGYYLNGSVIRYAKVVVGQ